MNNDTSILIKATLSLYLESLTEAWRGFVKNWRVPFFHIVLIIPISFLFQTLSFLFVGLAGSFVAGFLLALLASCYLATVSYASKKEKLELSELWEVTLQLFSPVISVLFIFFIATFLIGMTLGQSIPLLVILLKVGLAVLLNPVPEEIIMRGGQGLETIKESFDFVKENFVEWFLPWILCFLIFVVPFVGLERAIAIILMMEPLNLIRSVFFLFNPNDLISSPLKTVIVVVIFFLTYFIFVFRAVLYYKLATSSRRKRLYRYKSGEV